MAKKKGSSPFSAVSVHMHAAIILHSNCCKRCVEQSPTALVLTGSCLMSPPALMNSISYRFTGVQAARRLNVVVC